MMVLLLVVAWSKVHAAAPQDYLNLSGKLVELRGKVSDLNNELEMLREEHKLAMRGLMAQKNAVESSIGQDEASLQKMQDDLMKNREMIKSIGADNESVRQALLKQTARLKIYINSGLPFKLKERIADVESFEQALEAGVMSSHKAVNTLWSMIEDELKLSHENAVYRQPINVDGKENLGHVAKLGSMLMYFRLNDERYGMYRKTQQGWLAEVSQDSSQVKQIKTLFSALEKQLRSGYFELPGQIQP